MENCLGSSALKSWQIFKYLWAFCTVKEPPAPLSWLVSGCDRYKSKAVLIGAPKYEKRSYETRSVELAKEKNFQLEDLSKFPRCIAHHRCAC